MPTQFASFRQVSSSPIVNTISGGSLSAGNLYLRLYCLNRVGSNLGSASVQVSFAANERLRITIDATARKSAEQIESFVIGGSTTAAPETFVQLLRVDGRQVGGAFIPLPTTVYLSTNAHVALSASVTTRSNLPAGQDLVHGMHRGVQDEAVILEYDAIAGEWFEVSSFSTYVSTTAAAGGSDQLVDTVTESSVRLVPYALDRTAGVPIVLWFKGQPNQPAIPQGARLGLVVTIQGEPVSQLFSGKLRTVFLGYANLTTGELNSSMTGVGIERPWHYGKSNLHLPEDLPSGQAAAYAIFPQFGAEELDGLVPQGAVVSVNLSQFAQSGAYTEVGAISGDFIAGEGNRRRVVPDFGLGLTVLSGSGVVDSFRFLAPETTVGNLSANTANQIISINGNGSVFVESQSLPLPDTESIRAIVSTAAGVGSASAATSYVPVANNSRLQITVNYPSNGTTGTVRADYPDVIAATALGRFNPKDVVLYVQQLSTGVIRSFTCPIVDAASQQFTLSDWSSGTVVSSIPTAPNPQFSLYAPGSSSLTAVASGTFPADSYRVRTAFSYDGNQVTAISHSPSDGCLYEAGGSLAEVFGHLDRHDNPHNITLSQLGGLPLGTPTDGIPEGLVNLYYSDARVEAKIHAMLEAGQLSAAGGTSMYEFCNAL